MEEVPLFNNNENIHQNTNDNFKNDNDFCIVKTNKITIENILLKDECTQTEPSELYTKENKEEKNVKEVQIILETKKKRKDSPDDIRPKIFNYFNKMIYFWISSTKNLNSDIEIIQYSLEKNNKQCIAQQMNKLLKELFVSQDNINNIEQIDNKLLKDKLNLKYEKAYKYFISGPNEIKGKEELFENFSFLEDYLKNLEKKESKEYISKVKEVATRYDEWKDKKVHLFKK